MGIQATPTIATNGVLTDAPPSGEPAKLDASLFFFGQAFRITLLNIDFSRLRYSF